MGASAQTCSSCHPEIARTYARSGMGRSFRAVRPETRLPEFDGARFDHAPSRQQFTAYRSSGKYFVRRQQTGAEGKPINVFEEPVDYVIGSGNHAVSYLHRRRDDTLIE